MSVFMVAPLTGVMRLNLPSSVTAVHFSSKRNPQFTAWNACVCLLRKEVNPEPPSEGLVNQSQMKGESSL